MNFLWLFLLLSLQVYASPLEEAQLIIDLQAHNYSLTNRLYEFSKAFLGKPYGDNGPLGEGPDARFDQDPLYRFDTFDCTTYLETVIALALARDAREFEQHMNLIRYEHGEVDYLKRNHVTSLQWIPFNVKNGYLREINTVIVNAYQLQVAQAEIDFPNWLKKHTLTRIQVPGASAEEKVLLLEELRSMANQFEVKLARLNYVPIKMLIDNPKLLLKIPDATIVNFVRPNWDLREAIGTHLNISHQGFLFWEGRTLMLRHASSGGRKEVTDQPFIEYLKQFETSPTMKGVHFMKVVNR